MPLIIILATITPFVIVDKMFFPFITGKAFYFRILVEIAALLYIVWAMVDKSVRPRLTPVAITVSVFLGALTLATVFAVDPLKSFWSNYERMEGLILFIHLAAYFLIAGSVMKIKEGWWKWFFNVSMVLSVFVGIDAFVDFYSDPNRVGYRIFGNLGNSSYLGVYAMIHVFIALFFIIRTVGNKTIKTVFNEGLWVSLGFYSLIGIFNLVVLFNTGTRGSFIGLVAGLFVGSLLIAFTERKNIMLRNIGIVITTISILFVVALGMGKNTEFVKKSDMLSRFAELVTFDLKKVLAEQGKSRNLLWGMAWQGVKEKPAMGWGLDNFHYVFAEQYDPAMYGQEQWFDRAHNVFMDWLTQAGFLGFFAYLSLFGSALFVIWKKREDEHADKIFILSSGERAILTGALIAYMGHNLFVFDNLSSYVMFFSFLAFVHQYGVQGTRIGAAKTVVKHDSKHESKPAHVKDAAYSDMNEGLFMAGVMIVLALFSYTIFTFNIKPILANGELIESLRPATLDPKTKKVVATTAKSKFEHLQASIAYNTMTNSEQVEQLADRGAELMSAANVTNEYKESAHKYITEQYAKVFNRTPQDPRPAFFYAIYLQKVGLINDAVLAAERVVSLSPNKQSFLTFYGSLLLQTGDNPKALAQMEKAYTLDEANVDAKYMFAAALVQNGRYFDAEKIALENFSVFAINPYVIDAYARTNQANRLINLIKKQIQVEPINLDLQSALASIYMRNGNASEAISTLEGIKKIAPQYEKNINAAIEQIKAQIKAQTK